MATIDVTRLPVEVVEVPREELLRALDAECRRLLGMSGADFLRTVKAGEDLEGNATAARLRVLAQALIDTE